MNLQLIPSDQFTQAKDLLSKGFSYQELKKASATGGGYWSGLYARSVTVTASFTEVRI